MSVQDLELLAAITIGAVLTAASGYAAGAAVALTLFAAVVTALRVLRRRRLRGQDGGAW